MYSEICEDQKVLHFLHNKNRIGNKSCEIKQVATKYKGDYNLFCIDATYIESFAESM